MKIHKLANIIAIPFGLCFIVIAYIVYYNPESNALLWALIPTVFLVLIYLFSPQINYWWLTKNPIPLDQPIVNMLNRTNSIYPSLSTEKRFEFDKRLMLFVAGKDFIGKGREEDSNNIPYDIKNMISQIPITMTIDQKEFTFKNFDRIVLYKHPFPTPNHKFLHTVETHVEDGVIILSLEHVQKALFNKGQSYDITWHAFADAYIKLNPNEAYPEFDESIWSAIEQISPQTKEEILRTLGFKSIDPLPVLINLFFNYKEKFSQTLPKINFQLESIFNKNAHS